MAPPDADGAVGWGAEPALIARNVDAAQCRVEMGCAARRLGPGRARGEDHQRLQKQTDESTPVMQHSFPSEGWTETPAVAVPPPLGRGNLPGALAGGDRRGAGLHSDHVMERMARRQRAR